MVTKTVQCTCTFNIYIVWKSRSNDEHVLTLKYLWSTMDVICNYNKHSIAIREQYIKSDFNFTL